MVWLQKIYLLDVMSAGEGLWLLSLAPPPQAVLLQPDFCVFLFHEVLCFLDFYTLCPILLALSFRFPLLLPVDAFWFLSLISVLS